MLKFRDILYEKGYCYVKITDKSNDYYGSIAKFVLSDPEDEYQPNPIQITYRYDSYNINMYFNGRLRWKGKSNKPKYRLRAGDMVLVDEDIDTVFKRVDKKEKQQSALLQGEYDIDGNKLEIGDKVLCLSIVYGGRLYTTTWSYRKL